MSWLWARLKEPSTWCALGIVGLALGIYLSTVVGWWRDFIYLSAAISAAGAILSEKGKL